MATEAPKEPLALAVERDDGRKRYFAVVDGHEPHILFEPLGGGTIDFQHTRVPEALRGRGVATALIRGALADVRARGERIVPTCPFVKEYLARNPGDRDLVAAAAG